MSRAAHFDARQNGAKRVTGACFVRVGAECADSRGAYRCATSAILSEDCSIRFKVWPRKGAADKDCLAKRIDLFDQLM